MNEEQHKFWTALKDPYLGEIHSNPSLVAAINKSQIAEQVDDRLGRYMIKLAEKAYRLKYGTVEMEIKEDMLQDAVFRMLYAYKSFDHTKCDNAYAYLKVVIDSAFLRFIQAENKQANLKKAALDRIVQ